MAHDIAAIGNALVDTQFMVELDFLHEIGMKPDEMVIQSREEQNAISVSYTHLTLPTTPYV